jgi:hypothetical protein
VLSVFILSVKASEGKSLQSCGLLLHGKSREFEDEIDVRVSALHPQNDSNPALLVKKTRPRRNLGASDTSLTARHAVDECHKAPDLTL